MLYGIISDIHGNLEALNAVIEQLGRADKLLCLGDLVGYGPNPNECVDRIRELKIPAIAGNHDKAVTGEMDPKWFNPNARKAVVWTQTVILQENLEYLKALPEQMSETDFQCVHGSLRFPLDEYISSLAEALPTFALMTRPLCFIGHSHRPLYFGRKKDGNYEGGELLAEQEILADDYDKLIVNVGAVGQPRDDNPLASCGTYDTRTRLFTVYRVEYDVKAVQAKMKKAGLPEILIERLSFGR